MANTAKTILDEALKLPANDRAALVETLILREKGTDLFSS